MNCDHAQAAISERMDGERLPSRVTNALDAHIAGCPDCRAFTTSAGRVRTAVRIRPAEQVPDLVDPIMVAVAREAGKGRARGPRRAPRAARPRAAAPVTAALVVGVVAGSLAVGGPWQRRETTPTATAGDVIRGVRAAAHRVEAYHATFAITEHGLPSVPDRSLDAELWFRAPSGYRLQVRDHSAYPDLTWTPTDLTYIEDGTATLRSGPSGCPSTLPPAICPPTRSVVEVRTPFSAAAPAVADLVVPLDVLANDRGITVMRTGTVLGRPAVQVELSFDRAEPLFPFLRMGGNWRPFYGGDRVELWVDAQDWSPLRWTVYPADDPARADWELRFGLPEEPPGRPILDVTATESDRGVPPADLFTVHGASANVPVAHVADQAGFHPVTPTATADLALTAAAVPRAGDGGSQTLLTYSDGLAYLRVGERRDWGSRSLFGPVGQDAQEVRLGGGVAYYEPAGGDLGRRLAIHTPSTNLYLETNLSREDLLKVAASMPVEGQALPYTWRVDRTTNGRTEQLSLSAAQRLASFTFAPPTALPDGYVLASVERTVTGGTDGVTLGFRQADSDLGGAPIRLYLEPAAALPPAASAEQSVADVGGAVGRWTPSQSRLEWVAGGVYRSLDGPGVDRRTLTALAASVEASA